jgi:hypothetical protein
MVRVLASASLLVVISLPAMVHAQSPSFEAFDVVSIKRNTLGQQSPAGIRTLPDGTLVMTNQPIRSIMSTAAPVPVREVVGFPDWVMTERYDIPVDDAPEIFTALQEQLGLKLQPEKSMVPVFVIEQIERPSEN